MCTLSSSSTKSPCSTTLTRLWPAEDDHRTDNTTPSALASPLASAAEVAAPPAKALALAPIREAYRWRWHRLLVQGQRRASALAVVAAMAGNCEMVLPLCQAETAEMAGTMETARRINWAGSAALPLSQAQMAEMAGTAEIACRINCPSSCQHARQRRDLHVPLAKAGTEEVLQHCAQGNHEVGRCHQPCGHSLVKNLSRGHGCRLLASAWPSHSQWSRLELHMLLLWGWQEAWPASHPQ